MARKRFRWTRARFYKARSLSRYFARHVYDLPSDPPRLLERLWELYGCHPSKDDPLLEPVRYRLSRRQDSDDIPF